VAAFKGGLVFISGSMKSGCAFIHCAFRRSFQTMVHMSLLAYPKRLDYALVEPDASPASVPVGLGVNGPSGPRTGISSGVRPGSSSGRDGSPGSRIGGGTSGRGLLGGLSRGGSDGCPGLIGGSSCGSIGMLFPGASTPERQRYGEGKVPLWSCIAHALSKRFCRLCERLYFFRVFLTRNGIHPGSRPGPAFARKRSNGHDHSAAPRFTRHRAALCRMRESCSIEYGFCKISNP
jgi:hypothetical protein